MIFSKTESLILWPDRKSILLDGCFDPLHAGHIRYLSQAVLAFPDHQVVVAVAADDDIRAKGREPLLPQVARAQVVDRLRGVNITLLKDRPTHEVIAALRPGVYVKGSDWKDRLPDEQLVACAEAWTRIAYLNTVVDSASDRLRSWALTDAEASLDRLEAFIAGQKPASEPWRPVTDYSFEARKEIEGVHPQLIKDVFQPRLVLDVGCGTDAILVRLLADIGIDAAGVDRNCESCCYWNPGISFPGDIVEMDFYNQPSDLVICREVLEHMTVQQIGLAVANLFRLSSKYVYITTRFSAKGVFDADTEFDVDPTHITCLSQPFLRSLCVLNGGKRRRDLEEQLDWQKKGRCLVYEVTR